jgi:hypothetical protein
MIVDEKFKEGDCGDHQEQEGDDFVVGYMMILYLGKELGQITTLSPKTNPEP